MEAQTSNVDDNMNIDKVIEELGSFGKYQAFTLVLLSIPSIFHSMYSVHYVFTAEDVNYRCLIPECESPYSTTFEQPWSNFSSSSRCQRFEVFNTSEECTADSFDSSSTLSCRSWIYENPGSFVGEFQLACQDFKRTSIGSIRSIGTVFGLLLTGYISDGYGRKAAFCLFAVCSSIFGVAKSFSASYITFAVLEFLEAVLGYGYNSVAFVLIVEIARPNLRVNFTSILGITYGIGGALFGLIASQISYWRHLLRAIYIPTVFTISYVFLLDESPRWLHVKRKHKEVINVLQKAAKWNNVEVSKKSLDYLRITKHEVKENYENKEKVPLLKIVNSQKLLLRILLCSFCMIAAAFVYYGLTINSVSLAGNKYLNFSLGSLAEVVATLLMMISLERFGRRNCIFAAYLLSGISCVAPFIDDNSLYQTIFFFIGKLAITYAFNSMYIFASELFPTEARSSLLATCSFVGRIGSILAPQTPLLALYNQYIPSILFAILSVLAAFAVLVIPETVNTRLPETVSEAESIVDLKLEADSTVMTSL